MLFKKYCIIGGLLKFKRVWYITKKDTSIDCSGCPKIRKITCNYFYLCSVLPGNSGPLREKDRHYKYVLNSRE